MLLKVAQLAEGLGTVIAIEGFLAGVLLEVVFYIAGLSEGLHAVVYQTLEVYVLLVRPSIRVVENSVPAVRNVHKALSFRATTLMVWLMCWRISFLPCLSLIIIALT